MNIEYETTYVKPVTGCNLQRERLCQNKIIDR